MNVPFLTSELEIFPSFIRPITYLLQTCQPLVKENLETHEKKSGDSTKNSEMLFFP